MGPIGLPPPIISITYMPPDPRAINAQDPHLHPETHLNSIDLLAVSFDGMGFCIPIQNHKLPMT